MYSEIERVQKKVAFWVNWLAVIVTSVVVAAVGTITYWTFEPDPLTVIPHGSSCSMCSERQFTFERHVVSSKPLDIYVQQRWYNLDGIDDHNGIQKEMVITEPDYYPLGKDFNRDMEFTKCVPAKVGVGRYEYRPWATYKVNPIKTIHRLLPTQEVNVICDFDKNRHSECSKIRGTE